MRQPLGACALVASVLSSSTALLRAHDEGLQWFDNYKAAIEEARRTQKPIFLEYRCEP
jgi:uncharacterized protein YyaL (SSP411 family)